MSNATDAAVKLAAEHDIDLAEVAGTGADGRITKGDVEAHVARLATASAEDEASDAPATPDDEPETAVTEWLVPGSDERVRILPPDVTAVIQDVRAQTSAGGPTAVPANFARVQAADNLQTLIALGSLATSEEERAVIRARVKELLEK